MFSSKPFDVPVLALKFDTWCADLFEFRLAKNSLSTVSDYSNDAWGFKPFQIQHFISHASVFFKNLHITYSLKIY